MRRGSRETQAEELLSNAQRDVLFMEESRNSQKAAKNRKVGLRYRTASNGYWVAFLLPIAIYIGDLHRQRESTTAATIITVNSFLLSIFKWMDLNLSMLLERLRRFNIVVSGTVMLIVLAHGGNIYEASSYVALHFTFPYVFYNLIKQHPRSFSFGEGVLVTSAFAYMFWGASQNLPYPPSDYPIYTKPESVIVPLFLQLVFFTSVLCARIILLLQKPWKVFILEEMLCLWSKCCIFAFFLRAPIQDDDVASFLLMWPFKFLFANETRIRLVLFWAVISFLTGIYLTLKNYASDQATSVDRKFFHFAMVLVFLPGIIWDHTLIHCCSAVVFFIFVLIETIRVLSFQVLGLKVGEWVDQNVSSFRDNQDEGRLLLTPLYLLVGCSMPVWLNGLSNDGSPMQRHVQLAASLSGILSIGIGDTFASIGGTYYGRIRWSDSRKTVEGTLCSIIAQILFITLIFSTNIVPHDSVSIAALVIGSIVNAIVEGNTDQIDNLVLPLITFIVVHLVGILYK